MYKTEFQYACIWHRLRDICIRNAAGDKSDRGIFVDRLVDREITSVLSHLFQAVFHMDMTAFGVAGHHDVFGRIPLVGLIRNLLSVLEGDRPLGMCQSCCSSYHNRCIITLAILESELGEVLCLLGVGRF